MSKELDSIEELVHAYGEGFNLEIQVDNDVTYVLVDDEVVFTGTGYNDVIELWQWLFPEAEVDGV